MVRRGWDNARTHNVPPYVWPLLRAVASWVDAGGQASCSGCQRKNTRLSVCNCWLLACLIDCWFISRWPRLTCAVLRCGASSNTLRSRQTDITPRLYMRPSESAGASRKKRVVGCIAQSGHSLLALVRGAWCCLFMDEPWPCMALETHTNRPPKSQKPTETSKPASLHFLSTAVWPLPLSSLSLGSRVSSLARSSVARLALKARGYARLHSSKSGSSQAPALSLTLRTTWWWGGALFQP
jgi:hypothetical protein